MSFHYAGQLKGHRGWVAALACPSSSDSSTKVVSASRDNTLISWRAPSTARTNVDDDYAVPDRRLEGHSNFVQDVAISNDGEFAVSASWDRALRLWSLKNGVTTHKFLGHTKDALTVAFSPDNRQIVSGGRDNKLMVWNVKGECMRVLERDAHTDWVSCVRFSPATNGAPVVVSGGWDNLVKVWNIQDGTCTHTLKGHTGHVNSVTVSPDGSLCASAGKDGKAKLWDLGRGEHLYELNAEEPINQICFSPNRYWLCAATQSAIRIYDLESKEVLAELVPETQANQKAAECTSVCWSADGSTLYSGYTDNTVRVWAVRE